MKKKGVKRRKKGRKFSVNLQLIVILLLGTVILTLLANQYLSKVLRKNVASSTIEYGTANADDLDAEINQPPVIDSPAPIKEGNETEETEPASSAVKDANMNSPKPTHVPVYFIKITGENSFLPIKFTRKVPHTLTVLKASLDQLFQGILSTEEQEGGQNFIPTAALLNNFSVENGTVYLDFNADFQFNEYGRVGLLAQLAQIVYTCTEFPAIQNVQILINGSIKNFLAGDEGLISIASPLNREIIQKLMLSVQ